MVLVVKEVRSPWFSPQSLRALNPERPSIATSWMWLQNINRNENRKGHMGRKPVKAENNAGEMSILYWSLCDGFLWIEVKRE